jgi:glycosyltransferase involved in cell wall biosynthesis
MNKPLLVYQAPVSTRSGYGDHARSLLKALRDLDLYNIKIISTRWGVTPMNQLDPSDEFGNWVLSNIIPSPPQNTDIFMQMTVPNEFQRLGKVSIGVTAGIETTIIPRDWIDGCNRMDFTIATSEHTKDTLLRTVYHERRKDTNQIIGEHRITKPVYTLFEGVDYVNEGGLEMLDNIEEDWAFLFVGHWLSGDLYQDRKDVGGMLQTYLAAFGKTKGKKPALIMKTSMAGFSIRDREEMRKKIESIKATVPGADVPIYLLHGDLSESEIWKLYNHPKVKAMVSFTHGEGFGRPLLEFSLTGKPVIASGWSGQLDFLGEGAVLLDGELKGVHDSAANQFILKESQWFHVNYSNAAIKLNDVFNNYNRYLSESKKLAERNRKEFSYQAMVDKLKDICHRYIKVVQQVELKLPTLPKLQLPKLKKIEG